MFKKLLAVALAILATLMIVSCQQPNNAPTEKVDPNMPEKIYKNPEMYTHAHIVMHTTIGGMDFYLVADQNYKHPYLLSFVIDDKAEYQTPVTAEALYVTGSFIEIFGYVTKENVYAERMSNPALVPSVLEITGAKNLYEPDESKAMTKNYAGWAAIVPADPKANTPEKAKISDSIYVIYPEGSNKTSGEMNNISTLAGYGVWEANSSYMSLRDVLPKMSEETHKLIFEKAF